MANESASEFARLIPHNALAQHLFTHCHAYAEANDPYHLDFMVTGVPVNQNDNSSTSFDETLYKAHGIDFDPGYFSLSFTGKGSSEKPNLGWRVGRYNPKYKTRKGNIDIMLASPEDNLAKTLAFNHFRLFLSPHSGFLLLEAGDHDKASLTYLSGGEWIKINKKATRLIHTRTTLLQAGRCQYELVYVIDDGKRESFVKERGKFIKRWFADVLEYPIDIPGDSHDLIRGGRYLMCEYRGHGTFGFVHRAIDTYTGHIVAVKLLLIRYPAEREEVAKEVRIGNAFPDATGLLQNIASFCAHGNIYPCGKPEKFHIIMPYAPLDLSQVWRLPQYSHLDLLKTLYDTLQGLRTLHEFGIMHRDIRPANMVVGSEEPLTAWICDFGKATEEPTSSYTRIGPTHTTAPEVWSVETTGPYTNAIDIWAFGYAIAELVGYRCSGNLQITTLRHATILDHLKSHRAQCPEYQLLTILAEWMLSWNPRNRPTATEALLDSCWEYFQDSGFPKQLGKHGLGEATLTSSQKTDEFSSGTNAMIEQDRARKLRTS